MRQLLAHQITVGDALLGLLVVWAVVAVWTIVRVAWRKTDQGYSPMAEQQGPPPTSKTAVVNPPITRGTLDDWRKALRR